MIFFRRVPFVVPPALLAAFHILGVSGNCLACLGNVIPKSILQVEGSVDPPQSRLASGTITVISIPRCGPGCAAHSLL